MRARVDDLQRRAGLDDVAAERVRERRLAQVADADRALNTWRSSVTSVNSATGTCSTSATSRVTRSNAASGGESSSPLSASAASRRGSPRPSVTAAAPARSTPRAAVRRCALARASSGASKAVTSTPTTSHSRATSASSVRRPVSVSPCGTANCAAGRPGRARRGRGARRRARREDADDLRRPRVPDAGGLDQHALARVEVADAAHQHARGVERRLEAGVPAPAGRGQAHAAEEPARRRLGRVEVAVRVEPQDAHVGHVAHDGLERGHADRAVRRGQDREAPSGRACPRPDRRPPAGSRASRAGRPRSEAIRGSPGVPTRRASGSSASASASAPRAPPGVRSDVRQRSAATLSCPVHTGSRFSKNALHALLDVVGRERERELRVQVLERLGAAPGPAGGASRPCPGASAAATWPPACPPSRRPRRRTPSAGTTLLTIPIRSASCASICSPSSSSSLVFLRPTLR